MPDCNACKDNRTPSVPYILHESEMFRAERCFRRLWLLCVALIMALLLSNLAWAVHVFNAEQETTVTETTVCDYGASG